MSNLNIPTVELVSTLRAAPQNGSPSSQDYNDSWTEALADLAALSGFLNDLLIPMLNGLDSTIQVGQNSTPNGLEGRFIFGDTTDTTPLFFDNLSNTSNTLADSLRILAGMVQSVQTTIQNINVEITAIQTQLSSTNQNDIAQALQNFAASLQVLTAQTNANTSQIFSNTIQLLTNGTPNDQQNKLNLASGGPQITLSESAGTVTITPNLELQINGTDASSQVNQNLIPGTGITITDGGSGDITIAASGGGGGGSPASPSLAWQYNNGGSFGAITPSRVDAVNLFNGTSFDTYYLGTLGTPGTFYAPQAIFTIFGINETQYGVVPDVQQWYGAGTTGAPDLSVDHNGDLQVYRNVWVHRGLYDANGVTGANGQVLTATGSGFVQWQNPNVQTATVTLTSAQILALNATPITLVAAPGTGKYVRIVNVEMVYYFGTTQYSVSGNLEFVYGTSIASGNDILAWYPIGFLDQTHSMVNSWQQNLGGNGVTETPFALSVVENQPVSAIGSGPFSGGDGTIKFIVSYVTITP